MKHAKKQCLRDKEKAIKNLLSLRESKYIEIFKFLYKYYSLINLTGKEPILPVFQAIYIEDKRLTAWKLAHHCNISRTTLFTYRNTIINDFNLCLTENFINYDEIAITKGDKDEL